MNQFDNEVSSTLKEIAERVETPPYLKDRIDKELLRRCPEYRKKIAVIFGGCSPEYSVSLQSAYAVISHMDTEVYTPVLIGISQSGDWFLYEGDIEKIVSDTWCGGKDCTPVVVSPNRTSHSHGTKAKIRRTGQVQVHCGFFGCRYWRKSGSIYQVICRISSGEERDAGISDCQADG